MIKITYVMGRREEEISKLDFYQSDLIYAIVEDGCIMLKNRFGNNGKISFSEFKKLYKDNIEGNELEIIRR